MVVYSCRPQHLYQRHGKISQDLESESCRSDDILTPLEIRYLERKLALAFRTNLTRYIHDLYLYALSICPFNLVWKMMI